MADTAQHQNAAAAKPPPPPPKVDPKVAAAAKEAQAYSSIGAQIILDYNGDGSLGARGGAAPTIEENTAARDSHYIALGLLPHAPSGPPPSAAQRKAREAAAEAMAKAEAMHAEPGAGAATQVSSLAAGLITEPGDMPTPPPPAKA
jgi:hypothetical protein